MMPKKIPLGLDGGYIYKAEGSLTATAPVFLQSMCQFVHKGSLEHSKWLPDRTRMTGMSSSKTIALLSAWLVALGRKSS